MTHSLSSKSKQFEGTHCIEELLIHLEGRYCFFKAILKVMVTDHLSPNYNDLRYLWLGYLIDWLEILFEEAFLFLCKVHVFWEGLKILQNLHCRFDRYDMGQIEGGDFVKNVVSFSQNPNFKYKIKMQPQNWIQYSQWRFFFCNIFQSMH